MVVAHLTVPSFPAMYRVYMFPRTSFLVLYYLQRNPKTRRTPAHHCIYDDDACCRVPNWVRGLLQNTYQGCWIPQLYISFVFFAVYAHQFGKDKQS